MTPCWFGIFVVEHASYRDGGDSAGIGGLPLLGTWVWA